MLCTTLPVRVLLSCYCTGALRRGAHACAGFLTTLSARVEALKRPLAPVAKDRQGVALPAKFVCGSVSYAVNASGFITSMVDGKTGKARGSLCPAAAPPVPQTHASRVCVCE